MRPHFLWSRLPLLTPIPPPTTVSSNSRIVLIRHYTTSSSFAPPLGPRVFRHLERMATLTLCSTDRLLKLITASFPNVSISSTVSDSAQVSSITLPSSETVSGTNTITTYLSPQLFPDVTYTDIESAEIGQWLTISALNQDAPTNQFFETLNAHLKTRTTILGEKPSVADLAVYVRIRDYVRKWGSDVRTGGETGGWRYIVRWLDFVQNAPSVFGVRVPEEDRVAVDVTDVKTIRKSEEPPKEKREGGETAAEEGGKRKKEKKGKVEEVKEEAKKVVEEVKNKAGQAVSAGAVAPQDGGKRDKKAKKEKAPKAPAPKEEKPPLSPALIDLRVGQILKCVDHPNASTLFMSTVVCGDAPDSPYINQPYPDPSAPDQPPARTVLSGLKGKVPIEEMQGRKVVLVCNLKPANMRGIKSSAMVLAASPRDSEDPHGGVVELVEPPKDAAVGERVFFEGYGEGKAEPQLNSKQKVMETIQPGFFTTSGLEVAFDGGVVFTGAEGEVNETKLNKGVGRLVTASGGVCTVKTLKGALVR